MTAISARVSGSAGRKLPLASTMATGLVSPFDSVRGHFEAGIGDVSVGAEDIIIYNVYGYTWRIGFSRDDCVLIASNGKAASMSFFLYSIPSSDYAPYLLQPIAIHPCSGMGNCCIPHFCRCFSSHRLASWIHGVCASFFSDLKSLLGLHSLGLKSNERRCLS